MNQWKAIHESMLNDIAKCWLLQLPECKQIEKAFTIVLYYYTEIRKLLVGTPFKNIQEEIDFYKYVKPSFTKYIDFYTILYLELNYLPEDKEDKHLYFWTEERKRLNTFQEKYADFIFYYRSGNTINDEIYFTASKYSGNANVSKIYNTDNPFVSEMDGLVSALLAQEMYHEFVQKKLEEIRSTING